MRAPAWIAAVWLALAMAEPAAAADYCVDPDREECVPTLAEALELATAAPDADRIALAEGDHVAADGEAFSDSGTEVSISGADGAVLRGSDGAARTIVLSNPASRLDGVRVQSPPGGSALELAGRAERVELVADPAAVAVRLTGAGTVAVARITGAVVAESAAPGTTARLQNATVTSSAPQAVLAGGTTLALDDVAVRVAGAADGLAVRCTAGADATLQARHVTVTGAGRAGVAGCAPAERAASLALESSVLAGDDPFAAEGEGAARITTAYSAHAVDPDMGGAVARIDGDPGLDADGRPLPGSPVVDAGDPAPLRPREEPFEDAAGFVRVTDGDGDGAVRRDAGAFELQPPAASPAPGNVLVNPDAEAPGGGAGPPPGWTVVGGLAPMTTAAYGTEFLPSRASGAALGGGTAFFTAGTAPQAALVQRIDIAGSAEAIDRGGATVMLSGLLGGYGADEDRVTVQATFRDPEGADIGSLAIGPVPAAERGNATNLLLRTGARSIPPRTRAVDVAIRGERILADGAPEAYTDAFADNLALVLSVPGVPVEGPIDPGKPVVPGLRPFAGVTVLTATARVSRRGRARVRLACASATVLGCAGTLELRDRLPGTRRARRIARQARFVVAAGRRVGVTLKLTAAARRALRGRRTRRVTLRTVANDGQGVQRRRTVPLRLRFPAPRKRSGGRHRR